MASTTFFCKQDVDGRDKPGHDETNQGYKEKPPCLSPSSPTKTLTAPVSGNRPPTSWGSGPRPDLAARRHLPGLDHPYRRGQFRLGVNLIYGFSSSAVADGIVLTLNEIRNALVDAGLIKGSA